MAVSILDALALKVHNALSKQVRRPPPLRVTRELLDLAFSASLRHEEGRPIRGALTYADPQAPDRLPICIRSDYPQFTRLGKPERLTLDVLVKLARAVDSWTASIAVHSHKGEGLQAWGILDQQVHANTSRLWETDGGFQPPGVFYIRIEGPGSLSVYHATLLLGALRDGKLLIGESDALHCQPLWTWFLECSAERIDELSTVLGIPPEEAASSLYSRWTRTLARLCVGVRRAGTGGAFLLTEGDDSLSIQRPFAYGRLAESIVLDIVDDWYCDRCRDENAPPRAWFHATAQAEDRRDELTGAVKLVTSLATLDGLVMMRPDLLVVGFGVKIEADPRRRWNQIVDGPSLLRRTSRSQPIDGTRFGTRHKSMFQYCAAYPRSVGIVVSQDGVVRMIMTIEGSLAMWDGVKVENYRDDHARFARQAAAHEAHVKKMEPIRHHRGFGPMPKTLAELRRAAKRRRTRVD